MTREDFNAGTPYSCWLCEQVIGELCNKRNGFEDRGLIKKYGIRVSERLLDYVMYAVRRLDDYPGDLRKLAVDIIRMELDNDFERKEF